MSHSEWMTIWSELDLSRQERLGEALGTLLDRGYVMKGSATNPNPDFRMLDHCEAAARVYLRVIGWDLEIDRVSGHVRAIHPEGRGRVRLGKDASLLLCVLRLLYEQRGEGTHGEQAVVVTIAEVQECYTLHTGAERPLGKQFLTTTLRKMRQLGLVSLPRPFEAEPETVFELCPMLTAALPEASLERVTNQLREATSSNEPTEPPEEPPQ